jgi:hypothetical protein
VGRLLSKKLRQNSEAGGSHLPNVEENVDVENETLQETPTKTTETGPAYNLLHSLRTFEAQPVPENAIPEKEPDPYQTDVQLCHQLLDAAGAAQGVTMVERVVWVAQRWVQSAGHSEGCQCRQCISAWMLLRRAFMLGIIQKLPYAK